MALASRYSIMTDLIWSDRHKNKDLALLNPSFYAKKLSRRMSPWAATNPSSLAAAVFK